MGTMLHCWWNVDWYSHYGEQYGGSLKTKNRATIWSAIPLVGIYVEENLIKKILATQYL